MNRFPDQDPQRGPRRYGPSGSNEPPRHQPRPPQQGPPQRSRPPQGPSGREDRTEILPPGALGFEPAPGGPGYPLQPNPVRRGPVPGGPIPVGPPRGPVPPGIPFHDPARGTLRRTPGGIVAGRVIAGLLSVAILAGLAFAYVFAGNATKEVATGNNAGKAGQAGVLFRGGTNILLIGSDARTDQKGNPLSKAELAAVSTEQDGGGVNTDTIMVVHIPEGGGKATAVSLPRDTWIPESVTSIVKGPYNDGTQGPYKPNKINSFYSAAKFYTEQYLVSKGVKDVTQRERDSNNAGRTELQAIVQAFTGLHIDHYAEVNLIGFYTLSNAIGGVPVCLNTAVKDPFSGADFKAGPQEISGSAAMAFVRQRHGLPAGDLDRVRRQQAFLAGATNKMLSAGILTSPAKLSSLMDAAGRALTLDNGFDLLTFASQMADLSGGNMTFTTIPTHGPEKSTNTDALATDPMEIKAFFSAIDGKKPTASTATKAGAGLKSSTAAAVDPALITVDVQNATKVDKLASSVSATLAGAGFRAGAVTTFPGLTSANQHASTTISYPAGAEAAAAAVRKALGGKGKLVPDDSISDDHVSVAAGRDLPAPSGLRNAGLATRPAGAQAAAAAAPTASTAPTKPPVGASLTAGSVGCVN